jgi:crossover junction endodeoxyribonuclease RuvC
VRLAAFDLSLTSTGWARTTLSGPPGDFAWESGVIETGLRGTSRLWKILYYVLQVAKDCDLAILEGYAHASQYQSHQMGELGGVVRLGLHQKEIPFVVVPPLTLKMFATGTGKGKKEGIFAECIRRLGYEGTSDDEADALWLLQMGIHAYDLHGKVTLPKSHLRALEKIEWPRVKGER